MQHPAMLRCALAIFPALVLVLWTIPARTALAPVAKAAELPLSIPSVYLHLPRDPQPNQPVQVLVALHGMGGNGEQFASGLLREAERNHWLVVAPTIDFGDWTDPVQVAQEDPRLIRWLSGYLEHLDQYAGVPVKPRVLLLGHSRGAQLAHRFAFFEPQRVLAVAAVAAGTYTLPSERGPQGGLMRFPFGMADFSAIAGHTFSRIMLIEDTDFWVGVGTEDNNPADLPRAWDQYQGTTRVQRALMFQAALHTLGVRSVLVAFRGEKHALSAEMAASAASFLRALDLAHDGPEEAVGSPAALKGGRTRAHF
ncbi:MAG: alpha/beta fold hydrolase [Chloroflexi bacterium]|nr:alpha/beta fold hydrolase [Chloroflexota bacterium]